MQTEFKDGSLGEVITANSVEALVPQIKQALKNSDVKCVRIFNSGPHFKAEEERKTNEEQMLELLVDSEKTTDASKKHAITCPICLGCGIVEIKDSEFTYYNKKCHGCEGKGRVSVPDEEGLFVSDYMNFDLKKNEEKETKCQNQKSTNNS